MEDELGIKRKKITEDLLSSELMKQISEDDGSYHNKQTTIYTDAQIQQEGGDGSAEWNITNPTKKLKHIVCKQQTTKIKQSTNYNYLNMERNKFQISGVKAKGDHVEESKKMDSSIEEKLEATKRKLHQGYEKAENKKRQRRIKVVELHQLAEEHQTQQKNRRLGRWHC